jgi:hypothetical protein
MADFNINLSGPQAAGAEGVAPVQQQTAGPQNFEGLNRAVDYISKGLRDMGKKDAQARKNAVVGEYINNEKVYTDALTSGQWNAAQVGTASRANYTKLLASYPEYATELVEAKKAVYDGTEVGEAQKQVDREIALRESVKKNASEDGYIFYSGMGKDAEDKTIDAYNYAKRLEKETAAGYKRDEQERAQNAENRAQTNHVQSVTDYQRKEDAKQGLVTVADKNFDAFGSQVTDLMANTTMAFEQKAMLVEQNANRIKQGLQAVAASNPEMAAPWQRLVDDIHANAVKMMDPKAKLEGEAAKLKAEFDSIMYRAKISAVADPALRTAVVGTDLFKDPALIQLTASPKIISWLASAGLGQAPAAPVVGTVDEKGALKGLKGAINNLNNGKVTDKAKATQEAINATNEVMKQTTKLDGSISPSAMKELSAFYSSTEFGTLAASGKVDMATMQNVKQVFQVAYEPSVKTAIMARLDEPIIRSVGRDGGNRGQPQQKMSDTVDIQFSGSGVVFKDRQGSSQTLASSFERRGLDGAQAGINALIHMGAHMEGTTDYKKYWESNRHLIMPGYYMQGVDVGTLRNGYKFLGGDARNQKNWEKQADGK